MRCENREAWLNRVAQGMRPMFSALDAPLPEKVRIAIGFASNGTRGKRIGECWDDRCSVDGHFEIFIRPDLAASPTVMPVKVAAILAHELVHAAVGIRAGHGPLFRRVAKGLGLQGKMTATTSGPEFESAIAPILRSAGALPHGRLKTGRLGTADDIENGEGRRRLDPRKQPSPPSSPKTPGVPYEDDYPLTTGPKRQTRRHIKCQCPNPECGYTVRTSRKWLDLLGPPLCPKDGKMRVIDDGSKPEEDE